MFGKKAKTNYFETLPIYLAGALLIIGFLVSFSAKSAFLDYFIILLAGFITGRYLYFKRHTVRTTVYIVAIGLFIGYVLGSLQRSPMLLLVFFVAGNMVSKYLHENKYIR